MTQATGPRPRLCRWAGFLALGLALAPAALAAQDEPNNAPWKDSFYPFFPSLGNNFPLIALHLEERKAADYFARTNYAGLFSVDVGQGFTGARMAVARFHAPLLWKDWRLLSSLGTTRETRLGYFGLGNDTKDDERLVTKSQPHYYEARRTRYFGNLEISRRLKGPLWIAGGGGVEYSNLGDLSRPSLFRTDFGTANITDTDVRGRVTLVLDLRDNEFNTTNGLFAQAAVGGGTGGDGYSRVSADLRGYVSIREGTVLAARVAGSGMSTKGPLNARFEMPVWEGELSVLGGTTSNRGLPFQRLAGKGVLFANAEIRHNLLDLGDFGAFTLFGFVDAGRVFEQEDFKLTTADMKVGAGGGLAIRLLRFTIWTFNFAGGPDGFQFSAGSGWAF
jgi:outer membrane protein assembly factor BamA